MKVVKAKYNDIDNKTVLVTLDNKESGIVTLDGVGRKYTYYYEKYKEDGGAVEAFETDAEKAEREAREANIEEKKQRAELLEKGSYSQDGKMWFNFESGSMFIQAFSTLDEDETLPWYDKDKNEVFLTYTEAKMYAKEIRAVLQALYGLSQNKG